MSDPAAAHALLLRFLRDRDAACPVCGYNMRNLTDNHCPECGRLIVMHIRTVERYGTAWVAAMIAACMIAGPGLMLIILSTVSPLADISDLPAAFYGMMIASPAPIVLLLFKRRLLRLPQRVQWLIAALLAVFLLLCIAGFVTRL